MGRESLQNLHSMGFEQVTAIGTGAAKALATPAGTSWVATAAVPGSKARVALITAESAALRWRDDGTDPTATVGVPLAMGSDMLFQGDLTKLRVIAQAGTGILNVSYYK